MIDPEHRLRWLNAASRDARVPGNSFKLAFSLTRECVGGHLSATTAELQKMAGLASYLTARSALDRLGALGYLRYSQPKGHGPLSIELLSIEVAPKPRRA